MLSQAEYDSARANIINPGGGGGGGGGAAGGGGGFTITTQPGSPDAPDPTGCQMILVPRGDKRQCVFAAPRRDGQAFPLTLASHPGYGIVKKYVVGGT